MLRTAPSATALAWAARAAGPAATVASVRELGGGMHAATHLVTTEGPRTEMVLRRFEAGDTAAACEEHNLTAVDGLDGFAPRLLAADAGGELFGEPAVLITRLRGGGNITPADPLDWARQLGRGLARLHAVPLARTEGFADVFDGLEPPAGGPVRDLWDSWLSAPRVLNHRDYWSGNTVWDGERLAGVVDWASARRGPREYDVAWCRDDLMLLWEDPSVADAFTAAYERAAGVALSGMASWDLWTAERTLSTVHHWSKGYVDFGRRDLTGPRLTEIKARRIERLRAAAAA